MIIRRVLVAIILFVSTITMQTGYALVHVGAEKVINKSALSTKENEPVTVFIHGTLFFSAVSYLVRKLDCPIGLTQGTLLPKSRLALLSGVAHLLNQADPKNFSLDSFYLYGWNGKLHFDDRENAARDLYSKLRHCKGPITLIGHSHGASIGLNLAKIAEEAGDTNFKIEKFIILACPVQLVTQDYIKSPIFKKIISFYSASDLLQVMDPQGWYSITKSKKQKTSIFSKRRFPESDNLIQMKVILNNKNPWHMDFMLSNFLKHLPAMIELVDSYDQVRLSSSNCIIRASDNKKPHLIIKNKKT